MPTHRILLVGYAAILFYSTHTPLRADLRPKSDSWFQAVLQSIECFSQGTLPGGIVRRDKLVHFAGYAILTVFAFRAARSDRGTNETSDRGGPSYPHSLWVVSMLAGFGLLDECTQPLFARTLDWYDYVANLVGIATGAALVSLPIMTRRLGPCVRPSVETECQFPPDPASS
jgi:VanZ family protein